MACRDFSVEVRINGSQGHITGWRIRRVSALSQGCDLKLGFLLHRYKHELPYSFKGREDPVSSLV